MTFGDNNFNDFPENQLTKYLLLCYRSPCPYIIWGTAFPQIIFGGTAFPVLPSTTPPLISLLYMCMSVYPVLGSNELHVTKLL